MRGAWRPPLWRSARVVEARLTPGGLAGAPAPAPCQVGLCLAHAGRAAGGLGTPAPQTPPAMGAGGERDAGGACQFLN
jgi:hypothetical protein